MGRHLGADSTVAAHDARAVTTSDSTVIPTTRALYIGTSGDLRVRLADQTTITFVGVPVGIFPIQVDQVLATSTTAGNIIALY